MHGLVTVALHWERRHPGRISGSHLWVASLGRISGRHLWGGPAEVSRDAGVPGLRARHSLMIAPKRITVCKG